MKENQAWYSSNIDYLLQSIACVQGLLNSHIAESRGEESLSLDDDLAELADIADAMHFSPRLEEVCQTFDLSNFERMILLCCAAQAIDPNFPNLFAIAHNNAELTYPTFQLACQCFPEVHWDAFTEYRPLRRWQLVHCATSPELPRACLQIDEAILHYLMGEPYSDPILTGAINPLDGDYVNQSLRAKHSRINLPDRPTNDRRECFAPTDRVSSSKPISLQPSYQKIVNQIIAIFQSPQTQVPIIQLCGTLRESQREIAANVSEYLDLPLYFIPSDAIPSDRTEIKSLVMRWQRWYLLEPSLLLLEIKESGAMAEGQKISAIDSFLESLKLPVFVATDQRLSLSHPVVITFDVAGLEYAEQLDLWQGALPDIEGEIGEQLERLAAQFRLSPGMIQTASAAVKLNTEVNTELEPLEPKQWGDRLWDFCRLQARPHLEGLAQRINVKTSWDDLVLPEQEKKILKQILAQIRQQAKVYQKWGFARKNQRGLGLTVLFAGTSGTGKTTAAEVLAYELNLDLYRIDLSSVMSKYIGETEKNLRRIFDAAETGGGILLFDEADALFGKRSQR